MAALWWPFRTLSTINTLLLRIGRQLGWIAIGLMVLVILVQVYFRYLGSGALAWPDEAARFLMLWMTGLMAPSAYRWGGFVCIEMLPRVLPGLLATLLTLVLLSLSAAVLAAGIKFGFKHVNSGWLFASSSLKLPLQWFGGKPLPIKLAWMYMSLLVGLILLMMVNIELILRNLIGLLDPSRDLPSDADQLRLENG